MKIAESCAVLVVHIYLRKHSFHHSWWHKFRLVSKWLGWVKSPLYLLMAFFCLCLMMKVILLFGNYNLQLLDGIICRLGWDNLYEKSRESEAYWLPFTWNWNTSRLQPPLHTMCLLLYGGEGIAAGRWWMAMPQPAIRLGVTSLIEKGAAWAVYKTAVGKFAPDCISLCSLPTLLFPTQIPSSFKGNKHLQRHNVNCCT